MTAQLFPVTAWYRARSARAAAGKAPRLPVLRAIVIRQGPGGKARASIVERRWGIWKPVRYLCAETSPEAAEAAAVREWRASRLPIARVPVGARYLRPFHINRPEPIGGAA